MVRHRARVRRARRWTVTGGVAAAIVVVLVAVIVSGGGGKHLRVEETPTSTTNVTPGHKIVSYHGVHVEVPASWPVVDGMHTQRCGTPFGDTPTAYLGPNENPPPQLLQRRRPSTSLGTTASGCSAARRPTRGATRDDDRSGEQVLEAPP